MQQFVIVRPDETISTWAVAGDADVQGVLAKWCAAKGNVATAVHEIKQSQIPEDYSQREAWRYCPVNGIRICPEAAARIAARPEPSVAAPPYDTSALEAWAAGLHDQLKINDEERKALAACVLAAMKDAQAAAQIANDAKAQVDKLLARNKELTERLDFVMEKGAGRAELTEEVVS
jgi:hypothetical protein